MNKTKQDSSSVSPANVGKGENDDSKDACLLCNNQSDQGLCAVCAKSSPEQSIQCANLDERCYCPRCHYSWYGSVSKCPACHRMKETIICYITIDDCRENSAFFNEMADSYHAECQAESNAQYDDFLVGEALV